MQCRRRHADVVEWAWFINSYGDDGVYQQLMNGDKDSFLLAFALANKITEYYQVISPRAEWVPMTADPLLLLLLYHFYFCFYI